MRRWVLGCLGIAVAVAAVGFTVAASFDSDSGDPAPMGAASSSAEAASVDEASAFQIRGNASGPAVFHAAFGVPEPTRCEIQHRYHVEKEAVLYNGSGVSQVRIRDGAVVGWNHHRAPTLVQAHAGEHRYRSDVRSEVHDPEGDVYVLAMDTPYELRVENRLRVSVATEHWAVPDAPNSSLELTVDCLGPVSPPEQVETVERAHLVTRDTATGGVGATVTSHLAPGVNLVDEGVFETNQRRVEAYEGVFCLGGTGYGETRLETPQGEQRWRMNGVTKLAESFRHEGPPGGYAYTVSWADRGCNWWLGLWPAPAQIGAG